MKISLLCSVTPAVSEMNLKLCDITHYVVALDA